MGNKKRLFICVKLFVGERCAAYVSNFYATIAACYRRVSYVSILFLTSTCQIILTHMGFLFPRPKKPTGYKNFVLQKNNKSSK
ncbi:MAG TPA: hypothetical protein PLI57_09790 [Spirochaetota bacterium]|nr:hypothetical protein [Spirochaetota bacterium]